MLGWIIAGFVAAAILVFVAELLAAWLLVRSAPREEMFLCPKHGPMRQTHTIEFMGTPYCPLCWHERMMTMEKSE